MKDKHTNSDALSAIQKILLAAVDLAGEDGDEEFSAESLMVAAWQKYPETFGLKDYEQYPDSNKVMTYLVGEKGMIGRGWLNKVGPKLYTLGYDGRVFAAKLMGRDNGRQPVASVKGPPPVKLSKNHEGLLTLLFGSMAYEKTREKRHKEIVFADARQFWGIDEMMSAEEINDKLGHVRLGIDLVQQQVGNAGANLSDGQFVSPEDVALLVEIHTHVMGRFARQVSLMCNRRATAV